MGAGGLWMPYKCEDPRIDKWSIETLDELLSLNKNEDSAIEIVPTLYLTSSHRGPGIEDFVKSDFSTREQEGISSPLPEWTKDPRITFQHLTIEMLSWQNQVFQLRIPSETELLGAGYTHAWFFRPPVVDPPRMLMVSL
jgi:D-amino-acid oxidase